MTWLVIANTNNCRIYGFEKNAKKLTLIKEFNDPDAKLKNLDLSSDKEGHYQTSNARRGAYSPAESPKDVEVEHFAREIAKELDAQRRLNSYDNLIIVAAPHMNGLISQHLNEQVKKMIIENILKDYNSLPDHELIKVLNHYHEEKYNSKKQGL